MVAIITDTTASIPGDLVEELQIELVPYYVMRDLETLRDNVDIEAEEFATYLKGTRTLPTTSNPSPGDYVTAIKKLAKQNLQIVVLTMTSKGSGAYQSCLAAVEMLRDHMPKLQVEVVDTLSVAMAQGWATIEAARAARAGLSFKEVVIKAKEVASKSMMLMTADTLRYLYMGGRIGRAQHLMGSLLNIKPIIGMQDGLIAPFGTARTQAKVMQRICELIHERIGLGGEMKAAFTHVAALEQVNVLRELVCSQFRCTEVLVSSLSPALAVHSGPGTVGLSFYSNS